MANQPFFICKPGSKSQNFYLLNVKMTKKGLTEGERLVIFQYLLERRIHGTLKKGILSEASKEFNVQSALSKEYGLKLSSLLQGDYRLTFH